MVQQKQKLPKIANFLHFLVFVKPILPIFQWETENLFQEGYQSILLTLENIFHSPQEYLDKKWLAHIENGTIDCRFIVLLNASATILNQQEKF